MELMCLLSDPDDTYLLFRLFSPNRDFQEAVFQFALEKGREASVRYKQSDRYKSCKHYVHKESPEVKAERERVARIGLSRQVVHRGEGGQEEGEEAKDLLLSKPLAPDICDERVEGPKSTPKSGIERFGHRCGMH